MTETSGTAIARLHYLTQDLKGISHAQLAEQAVIGGINWLQLRCKGVEFEQWCKTAEDVLKVCKAHAAVMIVNDSPRVAKAVGADGVHLGQNDCDPLRAREILGEHAIIGGTANTFEDLRRLHAMRVDYIGLGPFKYTSTKQQLAPLLGFAGIQEVVSAAAAEQIKIPIVAIGGIGIGDLASIKETGVYGVAVSSAISRSDNISSQAAGFSRAVDGLFINGNNYE